MDMELLLRKLGVIPVVKLTDLSLSEALADAYCAGGIPCAEITFRAAGADEVIRRMRAHRPEMLVGAGTVLTVEQAAAAIDAGAQFIVAPGTNPRVVEYALTRSIPMLPGVCTPTEVEAAMYFGLKLVKFFPAEAVGGTAMLKAISAPYAGIHFVPTGGITLKNLADYLALPCVTACGGTYMAGQKLLDAGDFAEITRLCRASAEIAAAR